MAELLEVGVLFAAVATGGAVANRIDTSVIPFYILTGVLLSEFVAGRLVVGTIDLPYVTESEFVALGAELGIVFLLFFLGLEFNLDRLFENRDQILQAGTIDFVINFGTGLLLGWVLFGGLLPTLLFAGIVYISSSAIVTKSLIDLEWIANDEAEPMLGTLVYEDLVIAVYLAIVTALVTGSGELTEATTSIGIAIGFIVVLLLVVYTGTHWFESALETDTREALVLRVVGMTSLVAGAALALGVSEAVAAFFIGMAVSSTSHADRVEELLEPVRDTFAAVFFFWIGLVTDPLLIAGVAGLVFVAALVTTPTKLLSGYLGGQAYELSSRRSIRVGIGLVARGEFSLIIATLALSGAGTTLAPGIAEDLAALAVGYVLLMSVLGTSLMQYVVPLERFITRTA